MFHVLKEITESQSYQLSQCLLEQDSLHKMSQITAVPKLMKPLLTLRKHQNTETVKKSNDWGGGG